MAARTRKIQIGDEWRTKIQVSMLVNRLQDCAQGKVELSSTQVKAIEILMRKVAPDLQSVEHSGEVQHSYVAELPQVSPSVDEWSKQLTHLNG